jgi:hypothetical protein
VSSANRDIILKITTCFQSRLRPWMQFRRSISMFQTNQRYSYEGNNSPTFCHYHRLNQSCQKSLRAKTWSTTVEMPNKILDALRRRYHRASQRRYPNNRVTVPYPRRDESSATSLQKHKNSQRSIWTKKITVGISTG